MPATFGASNMLIPRASVGRKYWTTIGAGLARSFVTGSDAFSAAAMLSGFASWAAAGTASHSAIAAILAARSAFRMLHCAGYIVGSFLVEGFRRCIGAAAARDQQQPVLDG